MLEIILAAALVICPTTICVSATDGAIVWGAPLGHPGADWGSTWQSTIDWTANVAAGDDFNQGNNGAYAVLGIECDERCSAWVYPPFPVLGICASGCIETPSRSLIHADGFETGDLVRWSATVGGAL